MILFLITRRRTTNSILALIIFVLMFEVIHDYMVRTRLILEFPHFLSTAHLFSYAIGPLIYLYILSLTRQGFRIRWMHILHFVPLLFYNISMYSRYMQSAKLKTAFLERYYSYIDQDPSFFYVTRSISDLMEGLIVYDLHKLVYLAVATIAFLKYRKRVLNEYSTLSDSNLLNVKIILGGYLMIWLLIPLQRFSGHMGLDTVTVSDMGYLMIPLHLYLLSFFSLIQKPSNLKNAEKQQRHDSSKLGSIIQTCDQIMSNEELYLRTDLTLTSLSKRLDQRAHDVSLAINSQKGVNFFDYVNAFRVEKARALLIDQANDKYTIEHIGELSGYSSKATFFRSFKKLTGQTPSSFQKEAR